ncbi:MAG: hypothetical protein ACXVQ0_06015 [Actinomycetota bacterium]
MKSHLRAGRATAVIFGACLLVTATGAWSASADTCSPTTVDCVDQTVGQVLASATDAPSAVDTTTGTVTTVVDATTDQAADAVSDVGGAVPAPVDTVTDPVVDDVAAVLRGNGPSDPAPTSGDGTGSSGDDGAPGGSTTHGDPNGSPAASSPSRQPRAHLAVGRIGIARIAAARGVAAAVTSSAATGEGTHPVRRPTPTEHGGAIGRVARALRFPILLLVAILLFVTFQQRADRKAPKLALAPVDARHDTLTFG